MRQAKEIAAQVSQHYGARHLATALYGSLARSSDGPYSDIEMFVIVEGEDFETVYEWSAGPWKAEVDVYSPDVLVRNAAEFEGDWPITHGAYVHWLALHDPQALFPQARQAALAHTADEFCSLIAATIVGDLYEVVGKVRNALSTGRTDQVASYAVLAVQFGACLIGLHNRQVYSSGKTVMAESLRLPGRPMGYDDLAQLVASGELSRQAQVGSLLDAFWSGVEAWAQELEIPITHDLADLLAGRPSPHRCRQTPKSPP